jgi:predicted extracellular nuclease
MIRSLKAAFGLALLAALAVSAMSVVGASAKVSGHFTSDSGGLTVLDIKEVTDAHDVTLSAIGTTVTCHTAKYTASINVATTQQLSVAPEYTNCTTGSGGSASVTMNGCTYQFNSASTGHGTAGIVCPTKKAEVHTSAGTLSFGTQTADEGLVYTTVTHNAKHALTVDITAKGIDYTCHGACQIFGTSGTSATMSGEVTVTGTNSGGSSVNITAT